MLQCCNLRVWYWALDHSTFDHHTSDSSRTCNQLKDRNVLYSFFTGSNSYSVSLFARYSFASVKDVQDGKMNACASRIFSLF